MPQVYKSAQSVFGLQRPHTKDWYRIENKAGAPAQVHVYDEIGMWGVTAAQFIKDLGDINGPIEVHLSTPGGEVFDGLTIYAALKNRQGVTVIVDSVAASIGSVIAMGADPGQLFMEPTAKMMIHDGFAMAAGNADELSKMVEQLNSASDTIAGVYATRTGKPQADWRAAMKQETWYTADQAVAEGLADAIVGVTNRAPVLVNHADPACPGCSEHITDLTAKFCGQCGADIRNIRNADTATPKQLGNGWVQDADGTKRYDPDGDGDDDSTAEGDTDNDYWDADGNPIQEVPPCPASGDDDGDEVTNFLVSALRDAAQPHAPMTGTHSHPHPAFGSQGTDATHDHEHTHDGDASHSHSHADAPEDRAHRKLTCDFGHTIRDDGTHVNAAEVTGLCAVSVDNSPWNASKAWHNGANAPDPAAFYGGICAGEKSGDKATQAAWALPYKYTPSSAPNAAGVKNALSRLPQTQGLTNAAEAKSKLQGLMKQINPDYEPDDLAELFFNTHSALAPKEA